jgi:hypothetical protein
MSVDLDERVRWLNDDMNTRLQDIGGDLGAIRHWMTERTTVADERAEDQRRAIIGRLDAIYNLLWWVVLAAVLHSLMVSDILGWVEHLPVLLKLNQ